MCEPLSIATGACTLLAVCANVGLELKKFRNEAGDVRTTVTAMLADVKGLRSVIDTVEEAFEELDNHPPTDGHIATHWRHLTWSLGDANGSLRRMETLLLGLNREMKFLDPSRRPARIKTAVQQIATQRQEVQVYRDCFQLSSQTVSLCVET